MPREDHNVLGFARLLLGADPARIMVCTVENMTSKPRIRVRPVERAALPLLL